ncbi:hypothetical protein SLS58_002144 [Diplodia intermedia]|uniref:Meiotically up-regulated gene 154 protein n=1 Tax=Diplodia intermedia TaxID=856260 RepID=A0ABR3TZP9_9PEZI
MPPLIRRRPLSERIKAYLDPYDWLLWLSEELNSNDLDEALKDWAWPIGVAVNLIFMITRANSGAITSRDSEDVFGDYSANAGTGWFRWLCSFIVHLLSLLSLVNAFFTFQRKRHYRLFENPVETTPTTPSARRVRVDSSPLASSPLRFLSNIVASSSAQARAHPDANREVWEISIWDPTPTCLRLFCLFSPGHVLVYWLFLPLGPLDPRPSVTVAITVILGFLMTTQLHFLQSSFSQQTKDAALIHREVLHEYDTKFVHPNLNRPVRNVGTQTPDNESKARATREVDIYTPTTVINRGFRTNPNPAYAGQYDPDNVLQSEQRAPRSTMPNPFVTPRLANAQVPTGSPGGSSVGRRTTTTMRQPVFRSTADASTGDGGSLGVYSHAASPLRKPQSTNFMRPNDADRRLASPERRRGSPLKRMSTPGDMGKVPELERPGSERQRRPYYTGHDSRRETGRY